MSLVMPVWEHDCENCTFIGHFRDVDIYFCDEAASHTIVLRYSNVPSDYESGNWLPKFKLDEWAYIRSSDAEQDSPNDWPDP